MTRDYGKLERQKHNRNNHWQVIAVNRSNEGPLKAPHGHRIAAYLLAPQSATHMAMLLPLLPLSYKPRVTTSAPGLLVISLIKGHKGRKYRRKTRIGAEIEPFSSVKLGF